MFKSANKVNKFLTVIGLGIGLTFLIACASQSPSPINNTDVLGSQSLAAIGNSTSQPLVSTSSQVQNGFGSSPAFGLESGQLNGILVNGVGQVSGTPDLATLNLGVEAFRDTVQAARDDAADAMGSIVDVLKANGIEDQDIQTRYFNINPRFDREYQNVIGFQVSNQLTVKVRDLETIGKIIDEATEAGGDLTRFQGINFSIEDVKALEEQARAAAVTDMMAKANQLATLTGVNLGKPISISETGGFSPMRVAYAESASFDQAMGAPTPISPGEVDVVVNLQAVFAIQ